MESIGDLIGWMFLFVFGIWIGSLVNTFYIKKIYDEISKLNRGSGRGTRDVFRPDLTLDDSKKPYIGEPVTHTGEGPVKYCEGCSSPTEMHLTECRNCYGTSFVHSRPNAQK